MSRGETIQRPNGSASGTNIQLYSAWPPANKKGVTRLPGSQTRTLGVAPSPSRVGLSVPRLEHPATPGPYLDPYMPCRVRGTNVEMPSSWRRPPAIFACWGDSNVSRLPSPVFRHPLSVFRLFSILVRPCPDRRRSRNASVRRVRSVRSRHRGFDFRSYRGSRRGHLSGPWTPVGRLNRSER